MKEHKGRPCEIFKCKNLTFETHTGVESESGKSRGKRELRQVESGGIQRIENDLKTGAESVRR